MQRYGVWVGIICFEDTIVFDLEMHLFPWTLLNVRDP